MVVLKIILSKRRGGRELRNGVSTLYRLFRLQEGNEENRLIGLGISENDHTRKLEALK